jgi:hypothetical protein
MSQEINKLNKAAKAKSKKFLDFTRLLTELPSIETRLLAKKVLEREAYIEVRMRVILVVTATPLDGHDLGSSLSAYRTFFKSNRSWTEICEFLWRFIGADGTTVGKLASTFLRLERQLTLLDELTSDLRT